MKTVEQRFWEKVDRSPGLGPKGECWHWTASRRNAKHYPPGYGGFKFRGKLENAHRVSFILSSGEDLTGKWILHKCDNASCVRPDHLYIGDAFDNAQDRWSRGRGNPSFHQSKHQRVRGEAHGLTTLTAARVRNIRMARAQGVPALRIARILGMSDVTVNNVTSGQTWGHIS